MNGERQEYNVDAAIFDLDGVMINSVASGRRVKTALFARYGVDLNKIPDPHNEGHKGNSLKELLRLVEVHHPEVIIDKERFTRELISGVYEGGYKVWECSLDLVDFIIANATILPPSGKSSSKTYCATNYYNADHRKNCSVFMEKFKSFFF